MKQNFLAADPEAAQPRLNNRPQMHARRMIQDKASADRCKVKLCRVCLCSQIN